MTDSSGDRDADDAEAPGDIPARSWRAVLSRAARHVHTYRLPLLSAGVAFFAVLSIAPVARSADPVAYRPPTTLPARHCVVKTTVTPRSTAARSGSRNQPSVGPFPAPYASSTTPRRSGRARTAPRACPSIPGWSRNPVTASQIPPVRRIGPTPGARIKVDANSIETPAVASGGWFGDP